MTSIADWSDAVASDALQQWDLALQRRHHRSLVTLLDTHGLPIYQAGLISLAYHSVASDGVGKPIAADKKRDTSGHVTVAETGRPLYLAMAPLVATRCAESRATVGLLIEEFDVLEDVLLSHGAVSQARGQAMARTLRRHTLACSEQCSNADIPAGQTRPVRMSDSLRHDLKTPLQSALLHLELLSAETSTRAEIAEAHDQIHQSLDTAIALLRDDPLH